MYKRYKLQIHIVITLLIMAFIFFQSSLPAVLSSEVSGVLEEIVAAILGKESQEVTFAVRKAAHLTEFTALGISLFLTVRDLMERKSLTDRSAERDPFIWRALVPWGIGAVYAVSDEIHQYFVPGRSCEIRDMVLDSIGVAAGVLIMWLWERHCGARN